MQLLKLKDTVSFMSLRIPAMILSALLMIGSIVSLSVNSLNWGLDFTGGTLIEVGYDGEANLTEIRTQLHSSGFPDAVVQNFGSSSESIEVKTYSEKGILSEKRYRKERNQRQVS